MFLKKLTIYNDDEVIRDIPFYKGINLIVDETKSKKKTESGNSVGKTTVLRLIDFCLDGQGENIFKDPEFKDTNIKVEKFLKKNNIIIILELIEDIDDENSNTVVIKRNFLARKEKIQEINGEQLSSKDFTAKLQETIFKTKKTKPSFRQLISKNIRDEKNKLVNTIRVLSQNVITDATYESLHLFWFGISVDSSKDKLVRDRNIEERLQTRLRKENSLSQINQSLIIIEKEIGILTEKKDTFNVNERYEKDLHLLNLTKSEINKISGEISCLEIRHELILESKVELEKDVVTIDATQIKRLYEKAKSLIPNIQKSFEETLLFHNETIRQRMDFITKELPQLEKEINEGKRQLSTFLIREKKIAKSLNKSGAVNELQTIIKSLNEYHEKRGNFREQKRLWEKSNKNLKSITKKLQQINKSIYNKDDLIQTRISEFNKHFSDISNRLDGVSSLLSADNPEGVYKFKIGNIDGNPGTGGKKSQMASFDLAYIKFADELEISCLHFILQDQIENVHANQITNLLTEIVDEINCQYVLPVLKDKLPKDIDISQFEILSLSQDNKLFKID